MKRDDLTIKNAAELHAMLEEHRSRLAQLQFDAADKKLKRTSDLRKTRLAIARILTALKTAQ
jgi:ribosomal protein L29